MKRLATLLCCVVLALPLFGRDEFHPATAAELALKDLSWAPGANAVLLEWNVRHDDEVSVGSEYYRIKILKPEGKEHGDDGTVRYASRTTFEDSTLHYRRELTTDGFEVAVADLAALNRAYADILSDERAAAVLVKK